MITVKMIPSPKDFAGPESGLKRVVQAYYKYLPEFGIKLNQDNNDDFDIMAIHAGIIGDIKHGPYVAHLHGLY